MRKEPTQLAIPYANEKEMMLIQSWPLTHEVNELCAAEYSLLSGR